MEKTALAELTEHYAGRMNAWRRQCGKRKKKYTTEDFIYSCIKDYVKKNDLPEELLDKLEEEMKA